MDSNIGSDDDIGYGIIDLDPYLNALNASSPPPPPTQTTQPLPQEGSAMKQSKAAGPVHKTQLRCFLNYKRKPAGFVLFEASFREEKTDLVHMRF